MTRSVQNIVVVGGGTAGWLTAGVIAARHQGRIKAGNFSVTLVESPNIPIIGVGEGTWPTLRTTLEKIGVSETDLFRHCDAAFKQGSKFVRWAEDREGDRYYHPFVLPQGYLDTNLVAGWMRHREARFGELVCFQPHLCEAGRAPKQFQTPEFAAVAVCVKAPAPAPGTNTFHALPAATAVAWSSL